MAVYTEITDEEVAAFVADYDIGKIVACKGIAEGIENTNYLLVTDTGTFILTLYEKRVKVRDLPFFLALMEHMAARRIPCPLPVHGRDGKALRTLAGRAAAIVTFLSGMWPRRPSVVHCAALGEAMAHMHLACRDFTMVRANDLSVAGWRPLFEAVTARADAVAPELAQELDEELAVLENKWPEYLPAGVIHADLFPDNVFFEGERLSGIIDFYFACSDFFAYELAICLNAWCFEVDGSFNITKARRMITGYRNIRELSQGELDALPLLARGAAMRFLLTRLYDWVNTPPDALVTPKNPMEYIRRMRFHRGVKSCSGYGL
jgi:homoserine kinase type II